MPELKRKGSATGLKHRTTLEEDIEATGLLRNKSKKRKSLTDDPDVDPSNGYVGAKASRKILKIGQDLADEDEREQNENLQKRKPNAAFLQESRLEPALVPLGDEEDEDGDGKTYDDDEELAEEEEIEEEEVDANDLHLFNKFLPPGEEPTLDLHASNKELEGPGTNLADLILREIAAHEARQAHGDGSPVDDEEVEEEIPAKVVEVYSKVGMILSRYKSGKLPKPFKILPTLPQWETLVEITRPEAWTPNAIYEATRIFVTAKPAIVQRFLETVVLDRVRSEIHETKKLNVHLFNALKRSTYKPAGFFKGFLFPLVQSGTCTLREAHVVSGVLTRVSIPVLHSAAALMRLTDIAAEQASVSTESGGATNIFIRVLLEKKYALPYKVVDNLVFHFLRFRAFDPGNPTDTQMDDGSKSSRDWKLPVLWHQCLLAFAQRYRNDITEDQREALLDLLLVRWHKDIGPEVRRELLAGRGRGLPVVDQEGIEGGDDTMIVDPV